MNSFKEHKDENINNRSINNDSKLIDSNIDSIKAEKDVNNFTSINNASKKGKNKKQSMESMTFEEFRNINSKSLNKDLQLKYYSKLLLNSMGYYCDLEINLVEESFNNRYKKEQISDIDVLGCRFDNDLSVSMIPVECKSGERGALEELLKLKGVMDYLNTQRGYLIKNKIAVNAREMGSKIGISTLDLNEIKNLICNIGLMDKKNDTWINAQLENYMMEKYIREKSLLISKAMSYVKNIYWQEDNYRNFHNIIYLASECKKQRNCSTKEVKYVILQLSKYLSISILRMASYILHKNYSNVYDKAKEYLFGGAKEKREKEKLFDTINEILMVDGKQTENFEPIYIEEIIEITLRFIKSTNYSKKVPMCIEYIINTFVVNNIGYTKEKIYSKYNDITIKLSKDIIVFICKQANIDKVEFEEILNL